MSYLNWDIIFKTQNKFFFLSYIAIPMFQFSLSRSAEREKIIALQACVSGSPVPTWQAYHLGHRHMTPSSADSLGLGKRNTTYKRPAVEQDQAATAEVSARGASSSWRMYVEGN